MRVLVTGASGFIGRHLAEYLRSQGMSVVDPGRRELGPATNWSDALASVDAVIHLAALAHERAAMLEAAGDYRPFRIINALGTERLARSAAAAGARHFLFVSTIGVCGEATVGAPFNEETPAAPRSLYATSKVEAERRLQAVSGDTGLRVTVLRPTLVYGPGNGGNMLRLLRLIDRGWPLPFGSVANRRSLTSIQNLVSAITAVLEHPQSAGTFVVCDETPVSTPELIRHLAKGMGRDARLFACPSSLLRKAARLARQHDAMRRLIESLEADCGKLWQLIRWRPPQNPQAALFETGRWFRAEGHRRPSG